MPSLPCSLPSTSASGALTFLDRTPRSRWLSAAGGVAVAYVFLHILPELASHRRTFAEGLGTFEEMAERLVYSLALTGLAAFYGLERALKTSRKGDQRGDWQELPPAGTRPGAARRKPTFF